MNLQVQVYFKYICIFALYLNKIMFFFGSLTTLFPYAFTIIAMLYCIFTDTPLQQVKSNFRNEIYTESSSTQQDETDYYHYFDTNKTAYSRCALYFNIKKTPRQPKTHRPHLSSLYHYTLLSVNGNKAPPALA